MNLLYLANVVVAEVGEDYYWHWTHDQEIGKALIAACATLIAALIAIAGVVLTVRKTTQQIEFSKQGTPPELTRYKEWLEVSKAYKELVNSENVDALSKVSNEYKGIEASREVAFQRAVWERKVLAACPELNGQKRLLDMPINFSTSNNKNNFPKKLPNFRSDRTFLVEALLVIPVSIFFVFLSIYLVWLSIIHPAIYCISPESILYIDSKVPWGRGDAIFDIWEAVRVFVLSALLIGLVNFLINVGDSLRIGVSGEKFAEYGYLRILQEKIDAHNFKKILESTSEKANNSQRFYFGIIDADYREIIYYPEQLKGKYMLLLQPFMIALPYWVLNFRCKKRGYNYGEYRFDIFGVDKEEASNNLNAPIENKETYNKTKESKQMIRRKFSRSAGCRKLKVVRLNREESLQGKKGSNARGGYKAEISGINKEENPNKLDISVDDKKTYKKLIRRKFSRPAGCRKSKVIRLNREESLQGKKVSLVRWIALWISEKWESLNRS